MRVLIIDDDPLIRSVCRKILERRGFSCTEAQDGARALECVRRASFDVALLDLKIPGLYGMETLKKLRAESPNTAVIIIAGRASIDSAVEVIKAGAFDYLPKPFTPEVLTTRVRRAVSAVREALEESLFRTELERKKLEKLDNPAGVPPSAMGRVARLIHGSIEKAPPPDDHSGVDDSPGKLARLEVDAIKHALQRFKGNKTRAAECLGINRKTLREKIRKYGIADNNIF